MKQTLVMLALVTTLFFLTSCTDTQGGETIDDSDSLETSDEDVACAITDSNFLEPQYDTYITLRQVGKLFDYEETAFEGSTINPQATSSESIIKLNDVTIESDWGSYMVKDDGIIVTQTQNDEVVKEDEAHHSKRIKTVGALLNVDSKLIRIMVGDKIEELDYGVSSYVSESYMDMKWDGSDKNTLEYYVRRFCTIAVSQTEQRDKNGQTVDLPIGKVGGCFDSNQIGAVDEIVKMVFNLKLVEDKESILAYINTRPDGTVSQPTDYDYKSDTCHCYDLERHTMDCAQFDVDEPLFP